MPIPKSSAISTPTSYRPISLLPLVSKVLEKHFYNLIIQHLLTHNILTSVQWGFLEGRSSVTALIKCIDDWLKALEGGHNVCAVFFDYRKAFDSVPHLPLMSKLEAIGLEIGIVRWLQNYVTDRRQVVTVDSVESEDLPVLSGVPQGSVLGPLLFLIYINDLPDVVHNPLSVINLFVDDILLYHIIPTSGDYDILQDSVNQIEQWSTNNYLSFNTSNCKYMIVSRKQDPPLPESQLQLCGSLLERVERYKYLGVLITSDLSWSPRVVSVCSKARRVLGLLYRRFYGLASQDTLKHLYLSLVRPHMEYACQVWDPYLTKDQKALECVQKFAYKLATSKWDNSYDDLLNLMNLTPLSEGRTELKLGFLFKIV